jgi:hypothetical protein
MTGYASKRAAARDKLDDDDTQVYQAWRESASDYERGFIDGMQKQMQSSVDKAVNMMAQRPWVGLTDEETSGFTQHEMVVVKYVSKVLQEKNT